MSILSDYYIMLGYWNRRLKWDTTKIKFMATKVAEITCTVLNKGIIKGEDLEEDILPEFLDIPNGVIQDQPRIVVVVPVYVRTESHQEKLATLIKTLQEQSYTNLIILFVDDCSPFAYEVPAPITRISLPENKGPANARNIGIEKAIELKADIIAFTDSDCILHRDWAASIVSSFHKHKFVHALSGRTISYNQCWMGKYQNINGTLNGRKLRYSDFLLYAPTCNLAISKHLFHFRFSTEFPTAAAEDLEYSFKIIKKGFNIMFVADMLIYHDYGYTGDMVNDFSIFWKQFARYAKGEKKLLQMIPYYYQYLGSSNEISSLEFQTT